MMDVLSFARLTRAEHSLMLVLAVFIGQVIALGAAPAPEMALLAFLPPFMIGLASFSINDYFDMESDRRNKRMGRPLVEGTVSPREAYFVSVALFILGVLISFSINAMCALIALSFAAAAYLYSLKFKDTPVAGNAYIAATMAIPFIYGNYSVSPELAPAVLALSGIAFVAGLAREIAGDIRDMEGDVKARSSRTLPVIIGKRKSLAFHSLLYLLAIALSIHPFLYIEGFSGDLKYLLPILLTDMLIAYAALSPWLGDINAELKRSRDITLAALGTGLLGFLLGSI